jgi:hypothetical protein
MTRKTNIASVDNDAISCFDRIVMLLALLLAQRLGLDGESNATVSENLIIDKVFSQNGEWDLLVDVPDNGR